MEKYPLAPLLKVREYREDAAKNALSAAERAVVEAQEAVERCRGELERYKVWRQEEVERRYDAIMGKGLSLKELDVFKAGLGALADGELKLEEAIAQALENVKKRQEDVRKAREAARQAQHETASGSSRPNERPSVWKIWKWKNSNRCRLRGPKASSRGVSPSKGQEALGKGRETFLERRFSHPASSNLPIRKLYRSFQCLLRPLCPAFSGIERRLKR